MQDQGFPVIEYPLHRSPRQWGQMHGEMFRQGIAELIEIRTRLMQEKNPGLTCERLVELADEQWEATRQFDSRLHEELAGIAEGAGTSVADIVILNNYTDFRDISVRDQGCSAVFVTYGGRPVSGQTWDMHGSARNYVCCLTVPCEGYDVPAVMFSLVGCVGMMGFHPAGQMVGINNINTDGARAGAIWPVVVRSVLNQPDHDSMIQCLKTAPVTSGHSWLVATLQAGEFWEVMPELAERVGWLPVSEEGYLFHTNHCLGEQARQRELILARNTTTHIRYELLKKKVGDVREFEALYALLNDHENYPKSICSNFQSDAQDPSVTCGGGLGDLGSGRVHMWRGDAEYDSNFVLREFELGPPSRETGQPR